ncbi:ABC transporter ATP-binding protein [Streptomyces sp. NPDC047967]|uniref:ABC transporter ATP-binding protein n=1 Tax=Streptomyces sp. NPDC047967 TaxID=3154924 RepID=UPI0033D9718A
MSSQKQPLLELSNARRSFAKKDGDSLTVLRGVSMAVESGRSYAVLGRSGSGKSTLLSILGLLDQVDRGRYLVDGLDASRLSEKERAALRGSYFGFVFQRFFLMPRLTAAQNVELALLHGARQGRRERHRKTRRALERVGLADRADHVPAQLSGGEQQRVAIARAMATGPKVILADEPTGALDEDTADDTVSYLLSLCSEQGSALVVVTHDAAVAARMDEQAHLVKGQWDDNASAYMDPDRISGTGTEGTSWQNYTHLP